MIHKRTEEKIACKIINHQKYKDAATNINREVTIHRMLDHENIIKYFGRRQEPLKEYIFLEYALGGELFQLIGWFLLLLFIKIFIKVHFVRTRYWHAVTSCTSIHEAIDAWNKLFT